jgi:hypothetical protein
MDNYQFELDCTGFPMVKCEEIDAFVHWIPVTKVQLEYFLCDTTKARYDETWYKDIREVNPRVSPKLLNERNYWHLFATGIKPSEAQDYAAWCGEEYQLPTLEEWNLIYKSFTAKPAIESPFTGMEMHERPRQLTQKLEDFLKRQGKLSQRERKLGDQMLLRNGVMEWVQCYQREQEWAGMGLPPSVWHAVIRLPESGQPETPKQPEVTRLYYYGIRLIKRL